MKKISCYILIILLFSCTNKDDSQKKYVLFPDSTNYEYKPLKNGLLKVIRFFPGTKDTTVIYFINPKLKIKDSTMTCFNRKGNLKCKVMFKDSMKIRIFDKFYPNGNLKNRISENNIDNKITILNYYEETGKLKTRKELFLFQGKEYGNTKISYKKNGKINKDSTFYAELITYKDTVSLNDSLKIKFKVLGPENSSYTCYFGTIEECINKTDYSKVKFIKTNGYFYFKPKHQGINEINLVFEMFLTPEKNSPSVKIFCTKNIFAIK